MRTADIVAAHAPPGAQVLDRTPPEAELYSDTWLAAPGEDDDPTDVTLVLHALPDVELDAGSGTVVHVVFFTRLEAFIEEGLLHQATEAGWELLSGHVTHKKDYRFAAVLRLAEATDHLRLLNEYRYSKLQLRAREEQMQRLEHRLERAAARLKRSQDALKENESLREELGETTAELAQVKLDAERLQAEARDQRGKAEEASADNQELRTQLAEITAVHEQESQALGELRVRYLAVEPELQESRRRLAEVEKSKGYRWERVARSWMKNLEE